MAEKREKFQYFQKARKFARSLKLKSRGDWLNYSKNGNKPTTIPATPHLVYKSEGWISWGDWLGTGAIAAQKRKFREYKNAQKFAHALKLNGVAGWRLYCESGKRPIDIPFAPEIVYKDKGWISWGNWLGTGKVAAKNRTFWSFHKARKFTRALNLNSQAEWKKYSKTDKRQKDIPSNPYRTYKDNGWISWGDWLGTGNIATQKMKTQRIN